MEFVKDIVGLTYDMAIWSFIVVLIVGVILSFVDRLCRKEVMGIKLTGKSELFPKTEKLGYLFLTLLVLDIIVTLVFIVACVLYSVWSL